MNKQIFMHFKKQIINSTLTIFLVFLFTVLNSFSSNFHSKSYNAEKSAVLKVDQLLTLQYSNSSFKAGTIGFSEAKVSLLGGQFSCIRTSSGYGDVSMNRRTGKIDHKNSDSGEYIITYTINNQSVSQKIIVLSN